MPSAGRRSPETEGNDMLSRPQIQHSSASHRWMRCPTRLTILHLGNVSDSNVSYRYLDDLTAPDDGELLLLLDSTLQTSELFLLTPVIKSCH